MDKEPNIIVSVDMITYNHELYIAQAIEGVLMQKTNFKFELVIGEDCSTDTTAAVVKVYAQKYPDIIKARYNEKNLGVQENGLKTIQECTGTYMAFCEGDDYWTDPYKLQKQVDFLEANPKYVACGHESSVRFYVTEPYSETTYSEWLGILPRQKYTGEEFITSPIPFHVNSLVCRNILKFDDQIQDIFLHALVGDYTLYAILANLGDVYFFSEIMSVYNMRDSGIAITLNGNKLIDSFKSIINSHNKINRYFNYKYDTAFNDFILLYFDKMMFNKAFYQNKFEFLWDCLLFVLTNNYGKKPFLMKLKYITKILLKPSNPHFLF